MTNNIKNVWDQMVLFNQLTLRNILNGREDLGTLKLRAAVAALTSEQRDDAICFLVCSTEELAGLPDSQGIQAMVNVRILSDYLLINGYLNSMKVLITKKNCRLIKANRILLPDI